MVFLSLQKNFILFKRIIIVIVLLVIFSVSKSQVQYSVSNIWSNEQLVSVDSFYLPDTNVLTKNDSIKPKKPNNSIDKIIDFECLDSMRISIIDKQIILYGGGSVTTEKMNLKADSIGIEIDKKELEAKWMVDSAGNIVGKPVFKDGDKEYRSDKMRYNFSSRKGLVYNVITQEQNGFLHGDLVKMFNDPNEIHIKSGKYTTCDAEHPHFYIDISKAKTINRKRLVSGPLKLVIADIPIYPVVLPFGFFPLSRKNTSGIHFPTFKDELERGFGFVDFGYFLALNDHFDIDLKGEVYTKGSWGLNLASNIKFIYLFGMYINVGYIHFQNGPKELSTTNINNSFSIQLNYNQDSKAFPNSNLSANINYSYGNNHQLNARDINQFVTTTQTSSANYSKKFAGTPFNMSVGMYMAHNLKDSTTNLSFPTINFNMSNIYPFKSKKVVKNAFYERISLSFNSSFQNTVNAKDTMILKHIDSVLMRARNGFRYSFPLSTSFTVLRHFNISPSVSYNGYVYFSKITKLKDTLNEAKTINDTTFGFYHLYEYNFSVSASTRLFGIFRLNIGRLKAIRHIITPSLSYTIRPDFSVSKYGYYGVEPTDTSGKRKYSYFQTGIFGTPGIGEQQVLGFNIGNNFEAKYRVKGDTTEKYNKMNIIDNLSLGGSYNFAADSFQLSNINMSASTNFLKKIQTSFNASFNPYSIDSLGKQVNKFEWTENKKLARLQSMSLRISSSLTSNELFKEKSPYRAFVWSVNGSYSLTYTKQFNYDYKKFIIKLSQNLNFGFNLKPTKMWDISIQSGYDIDAQKLSSTSISFTRDLHCWVMSAQIIPFGAMKSYFFSIQVRDPMFEVIKFKRERSWWDN